MSKDWQPFEKILGSHKKAVAQVLMQRRETLRLELITQRQPAELARLQGRAEELDDIIAALNQ